jgi:hypothetical protein
MLKQRHFSIAQIAEQLGYTHVSHFGHRQVSRSTMIPTTFSIALYFGFFIRQDRSKQT